MEIQTGQVNAVSNSEAEAVLSIGDLAERTGVSAATLRVWESRHGFPVPHRRDGGHRRYDDGHVSAVRDVVRRREDGVRLDVAIEQAVAARRPATTAPGAPSVYARLRYTHPELAPQRLTKSTLLAMSWAIEDEFASRAPQAHLFGAFQRVRNFEAADSRWADLARTMSATFVYADFDVASTRQPVPSGRPVPVPLPPDHPMGREWAVVCDADELPVALTAWELPGQHGVRDSQRLFEAVWTVERDAVREAARVCADVATDLGVESAADVAERLAGPLGSRSPDLAQVTSLFNRVVGYLDARVVSRR